MIYLRYIKGIERKRLHVIWMASGECFEKDWKGKYGSKTRYHYNYCITLVNDLNLALRNISSKFQNQPC